MESVCVAVAPAELGIEINKSNKSNKSRQTTIFETEE